MAVVAFVELQFANPEVKPEQSEMLIVAYAATTALTVALMLNSMAGGLGSHSRYNTGLELS